MLTKYDRFTGSLRLNLYTSVLSLLRCVGATCRTARRGSSRCWRWDRFAKPLGQTLTPPSNINKHTSMDLGHWNPYEGAWANISGYVRRCPDVLWTKLNSPRSCRARRKGGRKPSEWQRVGGRWRPGAWRLRCARNPWALISGERTAPRKQAKQVNLQGVHCVQKWATGCAWKSVTVHHIYPWHITL